MADEQPKPVENPGSYQEIIKGLTDSKTQHFEVTKGKLTRIYWKGGILWEGIKK